MPTIFKYCASCSEDKGRVLWAPGSAVGSPRLRMATSPRQTEGPGEGRSDCMVGEASWTAGLGGEGVEVPCIVAVRSGCSGAGRHPVMDANRKKVVSSLLHIREMQAPGTSDERRCPQGRLCPSRPTVSRFAEHPAGEAPVSQREYRAKAKHPAGRVGRSSLAPFRVLGGEKRRGLHRTVGPKDG